MYVGIEGRIVQCVNLLHIYVLLQEGCIVTTTLLHYFILAVFCWTLCEGVIILVMLANMTDYHYFQSTYIFLLLGWGKICICLCTVYFTIKSLSSPRPPESISS